MESVCDKAEGGNEPAWQSAAQISSRAVTTFAMEKYFIALRAA
jgi:hypothetical protein